MDEVEAAEALAKLSTSEGPLPSARASAWPMITRDNLNRREVSTVAQRQYKKGDVVVRCRPFVKSIDSICKGLICDGCFRVSTKPLMRCATCLKAFYCSKECQKSDWKIAHQFQECKMFRLDTTNLLNSDQRSRLLARTYLMLRHCNSKTSTPSASSRSSSKLSSGTSHQRQLSDRPSSSLSGSTPGTSSTSDSPPKEIHQYSYLLYKDYDCINSGKRCFNELTTNYDRYRMSKALTTGYSYRRFFKLILERVYDWNAEDLNHINSKLISNSFTIYDKNNLSLGIGLYIEASVFNHSCLPNAQISFDGDMLEIRTTRKIQKGEDITISYLNSRELASPLSSLAALSSNYLFDCKCVRCSNLKLSKSEQYEHKHTEAGARFHAAYACGALIESVLALKDMIWCKTNCDNLDNTIEESMGYYIRLMLGDKINEEGLLFKPMTRPPPVDTSSSSKKSIKQQQALGKNIKQKELEFNTSSARDFTIKAMDLMDEYISYKISSKPYSMGEMIRQDIFCIWSLMGRFKSFRCDFCIKPIPDLISRRTCKLCRRMWYCSDSCLIQDQAIFHTSEECIIYKADRKNMLYDDPFGRLLLRFYLKSTLTSQFDFRKTFGSSEYGSMHANSKNHVKDDDSPYHVFMEDFNERLKAFKGQPTDDYLNIIELLSVTTVLDYQLFCDIFGHARVNAFYVYNEYEYKNPYRDNRYEYRYEDIAIGCWPSIRINNHSLNPNSAYTIENGRLHHKAIKPIETGEEITIGYNKVDPGVWLYGRPPTAYLKESSRDQS